MVIPRTVELLCLPERSGSVFHVCEDGAGTGVGLAVRVDLSGSAETLAPGADACAPLFLGRISWHLLHLL